jgi:hypothetical protein
MKAAEFARSIEAPLSKRVAFNTAKFMARLCSTLVETVLIDRFGVAVQVECSLTN